MVAAPPAPPEADMTPEASPDATPEVSVVIAHLNQPVLLARCLAALAAQDIDPRRFETVVVDNGSRSLPEAVVARFPGVTLALEPVPGPGPARNRGAALARAPLLAFTDADCVPRPDWLAAVLARFADPSLAIAGGRVTVFARDPADMTPAEAFQAIYAFRQELYINRQGFSVTANMAVRRAVLAAVGPFGGLDVTEDRDWGHRATRAGYRIVYAPEMWVEHPARHGMPELRATWDRHIAHFWRAAQGRRGRLRWLATIPAMALSPLVEIPKVATASTLTPRHRWRAFRGLVDIRLYRAWRMTATLLGKSDGAKDGAQRWNR